MSKRRDTFENRCQRCLVNTKLCFCDQLKSVDTKTKVSFIMHVKELALTSNTARICNHSLSNSEIYVRGCRTQKDFSKTYSPDENYHQLYLYPTDDSVPLNKDLLKEISLPIELVVPDASWNQAQKFHAREPILAKMPKVHLINQAPSIYTLRTQKYDTGVCTLEAVAYALDLIEEQSPKEHLLDVLRVMNLQNLKARQKV